MFVYFAIATAVVAAAAGFVGYLLRRNYADGYPATFSDWLFALVTAGITGISLLLLAEPVCYSALFGAVFAALGTKSVVRVWAAPRKPSLFKSLPKYALPAALAGMVIGTLFGIGLWVGFVLTSALIVWNAVVEIVHGDEQQRRLASVVQPLSAVLGLAPERIYDSAPFVDTDGTVYINAPQATTIARLDRIDSLVSTAMPGYEVREASAARIVFAPVSVETLSTRESLAASGGLIAGTGETMPTTNTGVDLDEW